MRVLGRNACQAVVSVDHSSVVTITLQKVFTHPRSLPSNVPSLAGWTSYKYSVETMKTFGHAEFGNDNSMLYTSH